MSSIVVRYDPMDHAHIIGFPNLIPIIDWKSNLPRFKDQKGDDVSLHLVRFHKHIYKLGVELDEDYLMRMFMASLEGDARSWHEGLPSECLCSLIDFHTTRF